MIIRICQGLAEVINTANQLTPFVPWNRRIPLTNLINLQDLEAHIHVGVQLCVIVSII